MTKEYLKQEASRELSGILLKHIDTLMDNECSDDHYSEYLLEKYIHYIIDQAYQAGQEAERKRIINILDDDSWLYENGLDDCNSFEICIEPLKTKINHDKN